MDETTRQSGAEAFRPPADLQSGNDSEQQVVIVTPVTLVNSLLRNIRSLLLLPVLFAVAALLITHVTGKTYVSESRFSPQSSEGTTSGLATFAAQFGFAVPRSGSSESIHFYAQLIDSRELLEEVARTEFHFVADDLSGESMTGTLAELNGIKVDTPEEGTRKVVALLRDMISVRKDLESNILLLNVRARWARLAEQVNRRLLDLVNEFNLEKRQSQAAAERVFVAERVEQAADDLRQAEEELQSFYEKNSRYRDAPALEFEAGRLLRRVDFTQSVYTTLAQAYEQARIDEVRNTPVITILDRPEGSSQREGSLLFTALVGLLLGGMVAIGIVICREYADRQRIENPEEFSEFERLRRKVLSGLFSKRPT